MSWTLADLNVCPKTSERVPCRRHHRYVCVDGRIPVEFNQIWLQKDFLTFHIQATFPDPFQDATHQIVGVGSSFHHRYNRFAAFHC